MKKIILVLGLLILIEMASLVVIVRSFRLQSPPLPPKQTYDNLASRKALQTNLSPSLKLNSNDTESRTLKTHDLSPLLSSSPAITLPRVDSSLTNYFLGQTGSPHPWAVYHTAQKVKGFAFSEQNLGTYLLTLANEQNRSPEDAQLIIENNQATKFIPHQLGQTLDLALAHNLIKQAIVSNSENLSLPVHQTWPKIFLKDLNNLGIEEFLARGQSDFSGSSRSRIQNIRVGSARFQGLLIKAGEEFSFNKYLKSQGPIDAAHGFLPELVIKPEGTVPEFGGGLCQVSTTVFRAAFFAGLPILERRNHSYPVKYYEWISDNQPRAVGLDATVYPGAQDMKFLNNTPGTILIWTKIEGTRLYFDFYGTNDHRQIVVDGPHPYDRKPSGAVKSIVNRTIVSLQGEISEFTLRSNYVSPNLYPKIYESPQTATPTPSGL